MRRTALRTLILVGFPLASLLTVAVALAGDSPHRARAADPDAAAIATNLATFAGTLDNAEVLRDLSASLPLQTHDQLGGVVGRAQGFADAAAAELTTLAGSPSLTLGSLDRRLDDLDGDGDPASDVPLAGVTTDIEGTVSPTTTASTYTVTMTWSVTTSAAGPVSFVADGMPVTGQPLAGTLTITGSASFRYSPGASGPRKFLVTGVAAPVETVRVKVGADFGDTDPARGGNTAALALTVGVLGASATGTADADVTTAVTLRDANRDGVVDTAELAQPATLFGTGCSGGVVHVALGVRATLAGLAGTVGRISLADDNVCNGIPVPTVALGNLADFRQVTPVDVLNGLAQLTTSLKALQIGSDLDLPFVTQNLSSVVAFNARLVKFFVDNGFTDPASPMTNITADPARLATVDTLQELSPKLTQALGLSKRDSAGFVWADHAVTFQVEVTVDPAAAVGVGDLDVGDQLAGVGITGVKGTAKATVDPAYTLDLGLGIDLRPALGLTDRFFFRTGADAEITADAAVTADLDLTGSLALLSVTAKDSNPAGAVTLLKRKHAAVPMLSVQLNGRGDERLTLAEIATAVTSAQLPFLVTLDAQVPPTALSITANVVGTPIAAGTVTVTWPDVGVPAALTTTADTTFQRTVLPFAYDSGNPVGSIGQLAKAASDAVAALRGLVSGNRTTTSALPLLGRSANDVDPVLSALEGRLDAVVTAASSLTLADAAKELGRVIADALALPTSAASNLVTLAYQPATASARAAVVAKLRVGICTTDRARMPGCTTGVAPARLPLNLRLGRDADAAGLAGLTTDGQLTASVDAVLALDFGVQLPTVVPGLGGSAPTAIDGPPSVFVLDSSTFELGVGVTGRANLDASLGPAVVELRSPTVDLAGRFRLGLAAPTGARLVIGSSAFTIWLNRIAPTTIHDTATPAACGGGVDACASLPVYLDGVALGTVGFSAPDLLAPSGWTFTGVDDILAKLQSVDLDFDTLDDGLSVLVQKLSDALHAVPSGTTIPLIGTDITAGVDVVTSFTDGVVTPALDLVHRVEAAGRAGNARSVVQKFFVDHVGPAGPVPLLQDANHDGTVDGRDVTVTLQCRHGGTTADCADSDSLSSLVVFEVRAPLGRSVDGGTPAFDIGFPGFRLASAGHLTGHAGFTYNLAFGLDKTKGFYIPTADPLPELQVIAAAALPNPSGTDNDLTGDIAFIPITVEDQHAGDDVQVSAGIDLAGGGGDGHLGLQELGTVSASPTLSVCANARLRVSTALGSAAGIGLPNLVGTLNLRGGYACDGSLGAPTGTGFGIGFADVGVDVGSFMSQFLQPVVHSVRTFTKPLEPAVDAIRSPIPGVEEAAGLVGIPAPTWYGVLQQYNALSGGSASLEMIDRVVKLVDIVRQIDSSPGGSGVIPIGSFGLDPDAASSPLPSDRLSELVSDPSLLDPRSILDRLGERGIRVPALEAVLEARRAGFSFPVWDNPSSLFGLLIGQDVTLAQFDAGALEASATFEASFDIFPLTLSIGGGITVEGHLSVGYDTAGFRHAAQVLSDDDPDNNGVFDIAAGMLQGLYVDDLLDGKDVPEIRFTGNLTASAGVGAGDFGVRVEGGVNGEMNFDLKDPNRDGRVHFDEFVDELEINPNPLCLFDASAKVGAFIQAVVDVFLADWTIPIADAVIYEEPDVFSFCSKPDPGLATKYKDGTLVLKTTDKADSFVVDQTAKGEVTVHARGLSQSFSGITRVFADGGDGNDVIQVLSHTPDALPAILCGGAGTDRLAATAGQAQLHGDDGPGITVSGGKNIPCSPAGSGGGDTLTSGATADTLDGGPGNDVLVAGGGADTLTGGPGNDTLRGGLGDDTIDGGDGDDTSDYGDHTAGVTATALQGGGQAGEHDTSPNVEAIVGSPFADTLTGPPSGITHIDGLGGNDTIIGTAATDILLGGAGNDTFRPGGGVNQVYGGDGDDTFVNGVKGSDTVVGGAGFDTVDYSAATTPVLLAVDGVANDGPGDAPDDIKDSEHLIGGSAADTISAASSDDTLEGRGGNDNLLGGGGDDLLLGGDADDRFEGGDGGDELRGGPGYDTADYGGRSDALDISVDDVANDGADADARHDNVRTDIEHVIGGTNDDLVAGRGAADDLLEGGPGDDTLLGLGGVDRLDGGTGDDDLDGGTGNDVLLGRDGDDELRGGDGLDRLDGGIGDNVFDGGTGNDTLLGGPGRDTMWGGPGADTITSDDGDDVIEGDAPQARADDGADTLSGGDGNDRIDGGGGNDVVDGGAGNDVLTGEGGNDRVTGSTGEDTVQGGTGDDVVDGGAGRDLVGGDAGTDTVIGGDGDDTVLGGPGDDTLTGGSGNDSLDGGDGSDVLDGGTNADQLLGGPGVDTATWASRTEPLELSVDGSADDGGVSDRSVDGGDAPADSIGPDVEKVVAGAGRDTLVVAVDASYTLDGGAGNDLLTVAEFVVHAQTLLGGSGNDTLTGGSGADVLDGGAGNDVEQGAAGNDRFAQGSTPNGADTMSGGAGTDLVDYSARTGTVRVSFDDIANDGATGERDNVRSDVERSLRP